MQATAASAVRPSLVVRCMPPGILGGGAAARHPPDVRLSGRQVRAEPDVVRYLLALRDPVALVERPMNAEVDAALPVLFLGLGQALEAARAQWAHVAVVVAGRAVELVRDERERDVIGAVEPPQDLEQRTAEACVPGRIRRERRREVRPADVAARRAERPEVGVAERIGIAVAGPGRSGARIRFAEAADRPPQIVEELRFPDRNTGIGLRDVYQGQEPRQADSVRTLLLGNHHRDLIVETRRRAQARHAVVGPEETGESLILGPFGRRGNAVAAETLNFIERFRVFRRSHRRRRRRAKLLAALHDEGLHLAPVSAERDLAEADRILAPVTRLVAGVVIDAEDRLLVL